MTDTVTNIKSLPELLFRLIKTKQIRVKETDGMIQLVPVKDNEDCTAGLRGILADCDNMSVDSFLARKRADKELDL